MTGFISKLSEVLDKGADIGFVPNNVYIVCSKDYQPAGELIADIANETSSIPVTATNDLRMPSWLDENSLVILIFSDSNKKEFSKLLSAIIDSGCKSITISNSKDFEMDNVLSDIAISSTDYFTSIGEILGNLISIFNRLDIISQKDACAITRDAKEKSATVKDIAGKLRKKMGGKNKFIISYPYNLRATARLLKSVITYRFGNATFFTEYPESNHNEIVGWCMSPNQSDAFINVFLREKNTTHIMKAINECEMEVIEEHGMTIEKIDIDGNTVMEKNLMGFMIAESLVEKMENEQ